MSLAPTPLTMDRLSEVDGYLLTQSTSQCCRCCCFQPSINWVMAQEDNFKPGTDPHTLDAVGWIHEESTLCGRGWSWLLPGCRAISYVQHAGPPPAAILAENKSCTCQKTMTTEGLTESDQKSNVVAVHEKKQTCGYCCNCGDCRFPICCCLPYLQTKTESGKVVGHTKYVCDHCCFVPKYDVFDENDAKKYRIRPKTCVAGCCVRCYCDGDRGKCCRVPFFIRHPTSLDPIACKFETTASAEETIAQVDQLWAGWKHECCTQKNAYHVVFPIDCTPEEKLLLTGSALLIDVTMNEQDGDN